jgi:hypothetical protein
MISIDMLFSSYHTGSILLRVYGNFSRVTAFTFSVGFGGPIDKTGCQEAEPEQPDIPPVSICII